MYERWAKRALDVVIALIGLIIVAPVLGALSVAIRLEDGPPVLFRQERIGRGGRPFTIFKLRSMPVGSPQVESRAATTLAVTRIGRFTRRTNLDELPQLLNVIRGEMSLVGPRPPLPSQVGVIEQRANSGAIHLRPGLTGLAQVNGYDGMPPEEKVQWDTEYARSLSVSLDFSIVLRTIAFLLKPPPTY